MPIDTSIYQVPQNNLLQQLGQVQGIANAQQQNQLVQQEQQQRGIQIDLAKADRYKAQLELEARELAQVYGAAGGNPTRDHLIDAISNLGVKYPDMYDKGSVARLLGTIPSDAEVKENPNVVKHWVISNAAQVDSARQAIQPFLPDVREFTLPDGTKQFRDVNPRTNPSINGAQIAGGNSADFLSAPAQWVDKNGQQVSGTNAQRLREMQGGSLTSAAATSHLVPIRLDPQPVAALSPRSPDSKPQLPCSELGRSALTKVCAWRPERRKLAQLSRLQALARPPISRNTRRHSSRARARCET